MFKFSLILAITLPVTYSGNAQNISTPAKVVLSNKDSTTTEKNIGQTLIDSTILKSEPSFNQKDKDKIYTIVDKMAQLPGGDKALANFFRQHLNYPRIAQSNGIQGKVIVRFVVNKFGKVEKGEVVRAVEPSLDAEALRIIRSLPDFIPAQDKGKNISVWTTMPVTLNLYNGN